MKNYERHYTEWEEDFTCWPYWFEKEAQNFDLLMSDLSSNFRSNDRGARIFVAYEPETKKIVGYSIVHYGIEIETSTFEEENELEILEFLINCSDPKYIIRENIKDNELQVYKKLGYEVDTNTILLKRKDSDNEDYRYKILK